MKISNLALFVVVAFTVLLGGCASTPVAVVKPAGQKSFTLLYQSARLGELEPCGCHVNPNGGIDREHNAIKAIRAQGGNIVYADAGNLLAPLEKKSTLKFHRLKAETVASMVAENHLDVLAPGPADYALGSEFLEKISKSQPYAFVGTNVTKNGQPLFQPMVILERKGVKFAFLSATPKTKEMAGYDVAAPAQVIRKLLPEAQKQADVIVVLSQLGAAEDSTLIEQVPGIHILVGSDFRVATLTPAWHSQGKTLRVDPAQFGDQIGKLDISFVEPFQGFYSDAVVEENQRDYQALKASVASGKASKSTASLIQQYEKYECLAAIPGGSTFANQLITLGKKYDGKNKLTRELAELKTRLKKAVIAGE